MDEVKMTPEEIVKLAAETGAKAAMETVEKERQRYSKEAADRRLRNTKLLLKNYRVFCDHVENAVYEIEESESFEDIMADLMMPGRSRSMFVESIKKSVARTATIVKHMKTMLNLYQVYCHTAGTQEDERRWVIINAMYIAEGEAHRNVPQLAKEMGLVERTIYRDIDIACERIAAFMFGIDGLKRR